MGYGMLRSDKTGSLVNKSLVFALELTGYGKLRPKIDGMSENSPPGPGNWNTF